MAEGGTNFVNNLQNLVNGMENSSESDEKTCLSDEASGMLSFRDRPIHEAVLPIIWLHGTWRTECGSGTIPNKPPFTYSEELQFASVGQPSLSYVAFSWSTDKNMPLHQECGFLRAQPNSDAVALMVGQNIGLAVVEEGRVEEQSIELTSRGISRMSFSQGSPVTETKRVFTLHSDNELEQVFYMATASTPLTQHLQAIYKKVD